MAEEKPQTKKRLPRGTKTSPWFKYVGPEKKIYFFRMTKDGIWKTEEIPPGVIKLLVHTPKEKDRGPA